MLRFLSFRGRFPLFRGTPVRPATRSGLRRQRGQLKCERLEDRMAPALVLLGSLSLGNQPTGELAVNPNTDQVYVAGGFGPSPLLVLNASDPANPSLVTSINNSGSGVTVNPATNRFYSSDLYGGHILVYDGTTNASIATVSIGFCPGFFDLDPGHNLIYVGSQCGGGNDPLHVLNGATNTTVAGPLGSGGVMSRVRVNTATGNIYVARSGGTRVFNPSYSFLTDLNGISTLGANPVTNRIYSTSGPNLQVHDGTSHALLATIPGISGGSLGVNTNRNRLYGAAAAGQTIGVIDGATNAVVENDSLGANFVPQLFAVDSTKGRLYVVGSNGSGSRLFVFQDSSLTATGTALSAVAGRRFAAVTASFTDSDPNPGAATDYSAVVDWGDGSNISTGGISDNGGGNYDVAASHTYSALGTFAITVTITDNRDPTRQAIASSTADVSASDAPSGGRSPIESALLVQAIAGLDSIQAGQLNHPMALNRALDQMSNVGTSGVFRPNGPPVSIQAFAPFRLSDDAAGLSARRLSALARRSTLTEPLEPLNPAVLDLLALNLFA